MKRWGLLVLTFLVMLSLCPAAGSALLAQPVSSDSSPPGVAASLVLASRRLYLPAALRHWKLLYGDDFHDPNSGWPVPSHEGAATAYAAGEYQVEVPPGLIFFRLVPVAASTFDLTVDLRLLEEQSDVSYGLLFRSSESADSSYYLEV